MALPDRDNANGPCITLASGFGGHVKRLSRAKCKFHHKSVGLVGGTDVVTFV